jgi:hypothetical protein
MKFLVLAMVMLLATDSLGQGVFGYSNSGARTRMGSADGPLAGTNVYAQMFAGAQPGSLSPVGLVDFHMEGVVFAGLVSVPGIPAYTNAYVQMVAWDSTFWGTTLANVPADQLGRTDVVTVFLTTGVFPDIAFVPQFTQPAIVPPIPEPSVWALGALALGAAGLLRRFVTKALK